MSGAVHFNGHQKVIYISDGPEGCLMDHAQQQLDCAQTQPRGSTLDTADLHAHDVNELCEYDRL